MARARGLPAGLLVCAVLAAFVPGPAFLAAVLLFPALVAFAMDGSATQPVARAVMLCGIAASIPPLRALCEADMTTSAALSVAAEPVVVAVSWCGCAAGWLLAELAPPVMCAALEAIAAARRTQLKAEQTRLRAAWGLEEAPADQ